MNDQPKQETFAQRHLEPADRLAEILCGLIMVLTFTLTAGFTSADGAEAVRKLLIAAVGCNVAWGIIDGVLYVMTCISQRSGQARLIQAIQTAPDAGTALGIIRGEVEPRFEALTGLEHREALSQSILKHLSSRPIAVNRVTRVTKADLYGALAICWLEILACLPAAVPFLIFQDEPVRALRVSNFLLIGMLFVVGFKWAQYARTNRLLAGVAMAAIGLAMVGVAALLGG